MDALARAAGLAGAATVPPALAPAEDVNTALADEAGRLGLRADPVALRRGEFETWAGAGAPLLLSAGQGLVALAGRRGRKAVVLGPDGRSLVLRASDVRPLLDDTGGDDGGDAIAGALEEAGITGTDAARVTAALRREGPAAQRWAEGWALRPSPALPLRRLLIHRRLLRLTALVLAAAAAEAACFVAAWWVLGRGALAGAVYPGWLGAFFLLLLTMVPLQAAGRLMQGRLACAFGAALRERLHLGALSLPAENARREGAGRMLGRVFESARLESFGLGAAFAALSGAIQIPMAAWVLSRSGSAVAGPLLLAAAAGAVAAAAAVHLRRRRVWTRLRAEHTHRLAELMLGHRTRLAQEPPARRNREEDAELARLLAAGREADDSLLPLLALIPRAFFIAGLLAQVGAVAGAADLNSVALGLGGVLLGFGALEVMCLGARDLCGALLAWEEVKDLAEAAGHQPRPASSALAAMAGAAPSASVVIEARGLSYTYPGRAQAAIDGVHLALRPGERVLLEGPTGAGKSTLAALLGGLREPAAGSILMRGLEQRTWGDSAWKRRVTLAPQFQENHVFAGPLALNLLLGRRWPPHTEDLLDAEAVCRELGLGPLIERMPAFLMQPVGDTGWQLSHGERTRVFLARALLQDAEVVLLDESFAALDPATLEAALDCARRRARTLVVVAHP
jgi:ATP-binding cassette subfamily B protein